MSTVKALTDRIRAIRESETSGRKEFCDLIGINKSTLIRIEQTGQPPKGDVLVRICQLWPDYTVWLMTGSIERKTEQTTPPHE